MGVIAAVYAAYLMMGITTNGGGWNLLFVENVGPVGSIDNSAQNGKAIIAGLVGFTVGLVGFSIAQSLQMTTRVIASCLNILAMMPVLISLLIIAFGLIQFILFF